MRPSRRALPLLVLAASALRAQEVQSAPGAPTAPRVAAVRDGEVVRVTAAGAPFATVHWAATPRPHVWPLHAPGGVPVTRSFPMAAVDGEAKDHPHHQSLWFAHGAVDGCDFWHGTARRERVEAVPDSLVVVDGTVRCDYRWLVDDGAALLLETRELTFADRGDHRTVDVAVTLRPASGPVRFGDTKEGTFALRLAQGLVVDGDGGTGALIDSEGRSGKDVWGKRARWIDDRGVVDGNAVGVAIFDHPSNLRHPTWWHARTYGLLAANPFGVHDFEKRPAGSGDFVLAAGETLVLRYRVVLHGDGWDKARVDGAYAEWVGPQSESARR